MQRLEVSGAVRPIYGSLGVKHFVRWNIFFSFALIFQKGRFEPKRYLPKVQPTPRNVSASVIEFHGIYENVQLRSLCFS